MKFLFFLMMITLPIFATDIIIVAAGPKLDTYDAETMNYLGVFSDMRKDDSMILTPSAVLQTKDGSLLVAGGVSANKFDGKYISLVKIGTDGELEELLVKQDSKNAPINSPKRLLELTNGDILVLDHTGRIDRFSATGEHKGDFFDSSVGDNKARKDTIEDIILFEGGVVVTAYQRDKKFMKYSESGVFEANYSTGNDDVKNPSTITPLKNGKYLLVDIGYTPKKVELLDDTLIYESDVIVEGVMKPTLAIKNELTEEYLVIDEGRTRESSYDDNLELFGKDGVYQKSKGTYKDGLLRSMIFFKGSTKVFK